MERLDLNTRHIYNQTRPCKGEEINMASKKNLIRGIVLLVSVVGGVQLVRFYRQPLGEPLALPTATRTRPTLTSYPVGNEAVISVFTETPIATATSTPQPLCGGPSIMNILAV